MPVKETHSRGSITAELVRVIRVELNPVLVLEHVSVLEFQTTNRTILLLVSPVPQRDCLRGVCAQSSNILLARGQVHGFDAIRVGIEECADRSR